MRRFVSILVLLSVALAAGCSTAKVIREKEREKQAIRAALQKYLAEQSSLNLSALEMEVGNFTVDRDRAEVQMIFHAKQSGGTMEMTYSLQREGGVWVVKRARQESGSLGVGAAPGSASLPAGHPSVTKPGKAPAKNVPAAAPKKQ